MFNMNPPMLCFIIELCLEYCLYNYLKYCIMGNLSISTNFIVPSVVNYQDGQQISMYLSFILDKIILIAPAIMHLKMVSAAFIRDMQKTPFKMHHCM